MGSTLSMALACNNDGVVGQVPRVELAEMGPQLDLALRRTRPAGPELEREAMKRAATTKKKVHAFAYITLSVLYEQVPVTMTLMSVSETAYSMNLHPLRQRVFLT